MVTVLIIEDHIEFLESITLVLDFEGYEVLTAENAQHGIELAQERHPDVILCDMALPDRTGREIRDILKQRDDTASIPFAFVSARSDSGQSDNDIWLVKPFTMETLIALVKDLLNQRPPAANE